MTRTRNILPPWAEIERFTIPGGEGRDCLRVATSLAYGIAFEDVPENNAPWPGAWEALAHSRGWRWWISEEYAPIGLERWIASVDSLTSDETHAVVMSRGELLIDANELARDAHPSRFYSEIRAGDVRQAKAMIPADSPGVRGPFWPITRPKSAPNQRRQHAHAH